MFIHFAFAGLKNDITAQTEDVINKILEPKRLKFSINPEFIPVFQPHLHPKFKGKKVGQIALESFRPTGDAVGASLADLKFVTPESDIHFLPYEMHMICFIKIPLKQLSRSIHSYEYGKAGIVLKDDFLKRIGIKAVQYYEEGSLFSDPLVVEWNLKFAYKSNLSSIERKEKRELETQVLAFRKPATLFRSFLESRLLAIKNIVPQINIEIFDAYARYPIGYNFREEMEWRIVSYTEEFLPFSESDLFMVIVPDEKCGSVLNQYFKKNWKIIPLIEMFP